MHFGPKAAKLYRGLAGKRRALVACGRITPDEGEGPIVVGGGLRLVVHEVAGASAARVYLMDSSGDAELCAIATKHTKADRTCMAISSDDEGQCARVIVALTDSGRAYLAADKSTDRARSSCPSLIGLRESMPAEVKAFYDKYIVTLPGPDASPPAGTGRLLDCQGENLVVANLLPDGTRRFVSHQSGVYSTNVEQFMGGDDDAFTVFGVSEAWRG